MKPETENNDRDRYRPQGDDSPLAINMTLLDYFAGQVIAGLSTDLHEFKSAAPGIHARWAYELAGEMCQERRRHELARKGEA